MCPHLICHITEILCKDLLLGISLNVSLYEILALDVFCGCFLIRKSCNGICQKTLHGSVCVFQSHSLLSALNCG